MFSSNGHDGLLIAYGSHHLEGKARQLAVEEAFRTPKPGDRLSLHDFETGGCSARWFAEVVNRYSQWHPYPHFSRQEMLDLLRSAGCRVERVFDVEDPFTLRGQSPGEAECSAAIDK